MEQSNYHEYNKLVSFFIGDQVNNGEADLRQVELLLEQYPFCQSLSLMYAAQLKGDNEKFKKNLAKTSLLSPQREVLYHFIHQPEKFKASTETYIHYTDFQNNHSDLPEKEESDFEALYVDADILTGSTIDPPARDEETILYSTTVVSPVSERGPVDELEIEHYEEMEASIEQTSQFNNTEEATDVIEENDEITLSSSSEEDQENQGYIDEKEIEDEVIAARETATDFEQTETNESKEEAATDSLEIETEEEMYGDGEEEREDELLLNNIISSDYFVFEKSVVDPLQANAVRNGKDATKPVEEAKNEQVSNYNDDKLPYTFLWWLDKTRREHADTYQPYVSFKLDTTQPIKEHVVIAETQKLNQQIIENIFHQQVPLPLKDKIEALGEDQVTEKSKDQEIIEKFIQQEPQIRHPQLENIDNENKARKSAEDSNDLVSETLAGIYIDQMLYQKAIDTYKKLSLKFPEKSAYFADQISGLQKKIN